MQGVGQESQPKRESTTPERAAPAASLSPSRDSIHVICARPPVREQVHHTEWVRVDRGLRRPQGGSRECERGYVAPARGPVMRIGAGTLTPYTNRDMSPQEPDVRRDDERRYLVGIPDVYSFQPLAAREATPWASKTRATCTR